MLRKVNIKLKKIKSNVKQEQFDVAGMLRRMSAIPQQAHEERAVALLRELEGHKTEEPGIAQPLERLTARLIDLAVWLCLFWVVAAAAYYIGDWFGVLEESAVQPTNGATIKDLPPWLSRVSFAAFVALVFLMELIPTARTGRSLSKAKMKLRVVGPYGGPPGYRRAAVRWLVGWVPLSVAIGLTTGFLGSTWWYPAVGLVLLTLAIPGWMFRDNDHRGLHDLAAGTRVLVDR